MGIEINVPDRSTELRFTVSDQTPSQVAETLIETGKILLALANGKQVIQIAYDSALLRGWCPHLHYSTWKNDDIEECLESPLFLEFSCDSSCKYCMVKINPDFKEFARTDNPLREFAIEQFRKMQLAVKGGES